MLARRGGGVPTPWSGGTSPPLLGPPSSSCRLRTPSDITTSRKTPTPRLLALGSSLSLGAPIRGSTSRILEYMILIRCVVRLTPTLGEQLPVQELTALTIRARRLGIGDAKPLLPLSFPFVSRARTRWRGRHRLVLSPDRQLACRPTNLPILVHGIACIGCPQAVMVVPVIVEPANRATLTGARCFGQTGF